MQELLFYLIKLTGCSAVLLLNYYLFLRNKKFHQYNRFYLLSAVVISFLFPLINIPVFWRANSDHPPLYIQTLQAITISNPVKSTESYFLSHPSALIMLPYLLVSVSIFLILIRSFVRIYRLSHRYPSQQLDKIILYHTTEKNTPFSFMKKIFWNDQIPMDSREGKQILRHELFHAQQLHSLDNVFMQTVLCAAWFNPFFHIIRKELSAIHEFLADQFAVAESDRYDYAEYLVVHAANQAHSIPIAHHFFNSPFKRRIAMILHHSNTSRFSYARKLVVIPLVILIFCSLAMQTKNPGTSKNTSDKNTADTTGPKVLRKPEIEASYPGGHKAWQQYLFKNLHYPQSAQDLEIQGSVVVQFIVDRDGSLRDVNAISGPVKGDLKEEAVRLIKNSGKWIPGKSNGEIVSTFRRQPITFRMEVQNNK